MLEHKRRSVVPGRFRSFPLGRLKRNPGWLACLCGSSTTDGDILKDEEYHVDPDTDLKVAFSLFDKDQDGAMSLEEVKALMLGLGQRVPHQQLEMLFEKVDSDGNGRISFEEFVELVKQRGELQSEDVEMRALLAQLDHDKTGYIDVEKLESIMAKMGMPFNKEGVAEMMKRVDVPDDGRICYQDFVKMMKGKVRKRQRRVIGLSKDEGMSSRCSIDEEGREDEETAELRMAFSLFDKDADGTITVDELKEVMRSLGMDTCSQEVHQMIRRVDLDGNGSIDFEEFRELLVKYKKRKKMDEESEMLQAFKVFDRDGSGFIDAKEILTTMGELGVELTTNDVTAVLHQAGVQPDGKLSYDDFVRMMQHRFEESFKQHTKHGDDLPDEMQDLDLAFSLFDKDEDGSISKEELHQVMRSLGQNIPEVQLNQTFDQTDKDGNGLICFDEFVEMMEHYGSKGSEVEEMRAMFGAFDKDGNGYIEREELRRTMTELGMSVTDEDIEDMMKELNVGNDGRIYFEDFVKLMAGNLGQTQESVCGTLAEGHPAVGFYIPSATDQEEDPEVQELYLAFSLFDKDGDGNITSHELSQVMMSLGIDTNSKQVQHLLCKVDLDGNGKIDFDQFQHMLRKYNLSYGRTANKDEEMQQAFKVFDRDCSGYIDAGEIQITMSELGVQLTNDDVAAMMQEAGVLPNGRIYYHDFVKMMQHRFESSVEGHHMYEKYTEPQLNELKVAFALFDKDKDGTISREELRIVMHSLGQDVTQRRLQKMFGQADKDGNGLIDFEEFVEMMELFSDKPAEDSDMKALFFAFDKDKNGYIDFQELKTTMTELGEKVSDNDIREMMKEVGVEQDRIYYEDFVQMMLGKIGKAQRRRSRVNSEGLEAAGPIIPVDQEEEADVETRELQVAFSMFDKDGDGSITSRELLEVMRSLGVDSQSSEVHRMIRKVDLDGNGRIEFAEFKKWMNKNKDLPGVERKVTKAEEEEMRQAFRVFDKDGSGYIDAQNLRATMRELGVQLREEDVSAMMTEAGAKVDGRIYYEDFVRIMFGQVIKPMPKEGAASPEHFQDLKVAFSLFDKDGDGTITVSELHSVMHGLGFTSNDQLLRRMIERFDHDGNGTLEFDEFMKMMTAKNEKGVSRWERTKQKAPEPESWRAFKVFDRDRNGFITAQELKRTMLELGMALSDEDVQLMMKEADLDGDGKINYQEFTNMMRGNFQLVLDLSPPQTSAGKTGLGHDEPSRTMASQSKVQKGPPSRYISPVIVRKLKAPLFAASEEKELRAAFNMFDKTKDGCIAACELGSVMRILGFNYTPSQLKKMISTVNVRGNGTVDFQEFLRMMSRSRSRHEKSEETRRRVEEEEMRQAFKVFDIDGNGYIDAHELRLTMQNLGEDLTEDDVRAMIKEADTNGDGKIDYEEFIRMMYNK